MLVQADILRSPCEFSQMLLFALLLLVPSRCCLSVMLFFFPLVDSLIRPRIRLAPSPHCFKNKHGILLALEHRGFINASRHVGWRRRLKR